MIFYRSEQHELLELLRQQKRSYFAAIIQAHARSIQAKVEYKILHAVREVMRKFLAEPANMVHTSEQVEELATAMAAGQKLSMKCKEVEPATVLLTRLQKEDEVRNCEERSDELGMRQLRSQFVCAGSFRPNALAAFIAT